MRASSAPRLLSDEVLITEIEVSAKDTDAGAESAVLRDSLLPLVQEAIARKLREPQILSMMQPKARLRVEISSDDYAQLPARHGPHSNGTMKLLLRTSASLAFESGHQTSPAMITILGSRKIERKTFDHVFIPSFGEFVQALIERDVHCAELFAH